MPLLRTVVESTLASCRMRSRANWLAVVVAASLASATSGLAGDLDDLAKPHEGRSMRSTSTAVDENGDYAHSNSDNSRVAPGATKVVLDAAGAGRDHAHVVHVPGAGAASLGEGRLGQPPGDAAADLLRRLRAAGRRSAVGRFLRQLLRQAERGDQRAGRRRGRRLLQLLLADAVSQVGSRRDRQPEREEAQPAVLQHRLDQAGLAAGGHALLLRPVPPGVPGRSRGRTT